MKIYKAVSMFAGIGGIGLGFQQVKFENARIEIAWANEIDSEACKTYKTNFDHLLLEGDINFIIHPNKAVGTDEKDEIYYSNLQKQMFMHKIDIIDAGFPCQAFSIAGDRRGFDDERGNLFWSIINVVLLHEKIHKIKPRILFLENVKNLKSHDKGRTYEVIKSEIEKLGYIVKEAILNTMDYTELPQNRERIYIVCFRDIKDATKFTMFKNLEKFKIYRTKSEWASCVKKIIDYNAKKPDKYYYTKKKYPNYFLTIDDYNNLDENVRKKTRINLEEEITEMYQFYQLRRGMYVRKNQSNVSPTLTANMGTGGHNVPLIKDKYGIRKLTPDETLRLQGFPANEKYRSPCSDSSIYKQAGNAVSVPVVKLIAQELLKILYCNDKKNM
jgi:DNA (cytosine-5)-methyltransferase 1